MGQYIPVFGAVATQTPSIKYEEIYLHDYATPREARRAIAAYIAFYNHERRHQSLDYATPASVYGVPSSMRVTS